MEARCPGGGGGIKDLQGLKIQLFLSLVLKRVNILSMEDIGWRHGARGGGGFKIYKV